MTSESMEFRKNATLADTKRDEGLTTPEDILRYDNICYGKDPVWQSLDVYRPRSQGNAKLPVIVSVHGGGWVYGDKEVYQFYCMSLAQRGFAVVNFTYRLAPENKFPAAIEDTNLVFSWIMANAEAYGLDTDHLFAVGDSAGAQNIGLYACIVTNPEYAARYSFHVPKGLQLKAIGLNCGVYNMLNSPVDGMRRDLLPNEGSKEELETISVICHITPAFPPCYIFTSNRDFLKDAPPELMKVLDANQIPYEYKLYGDEKHDLYHVFHCDTRSEFAKIANDDECNFFRKYF